MVTSCFAIRVPAGILLRGFYPILFFLAVTFFVNVLFHPGRVIYELGGLLITAEGLSQGAHLAVRLLVLILGAKILTATTGPDELIRAITRILGPFGTWKPVKEFIGTLILTVRFLPLVYAEAKGLLRNTSRELKGKPFSERVKGYAALIVPLFEKSIEKAKDLQHEL